jgi:MFS family permease
MLRSITEEPREVDEPASLAHFRSAIRGYPLRAFLICLCGVSLENMDQALFQYVFPQIVTEFNWTPQQAGIYSAVVFTCAGIGVAALGVLTDRVGRKRVFQLSMIVGSFFVATMFWARSTWQLLVLRAIDFATGGGFNRRWSARLWSKSRRRAIAACCRAFCRSAIRSAGFWLR